MPDTESHIAAVRHAQSKGNVDTSWIQGRSNHLELTDTGKRQAAAVGPWLKRAYGTPDVVIASPAVRTLETARIALEAAGLDMHVEKNYKVQELSQGEWEGAVRAEKWTPEVMQRMRDEAMDYRSPGGESMHEVQIRMRQAFGGFPDGRVWLFTHGLSLRCLAGDILGWDQPQILAARTSMYNTSVTEFNGSGPELALDGLMLTEHLSPDLLTI